MIGKLLGHSQPVTTVIYFEINEGLRRAVPSTWQTNLGLPPATSALSQLPNHDLMLVDPLPLPPESTSLSDGAPSEI